MTGGLGGNNISARGGANSIVAVPLASNYNITLSPPLRPERDDVTDFNPAPLRPSLFRSGGGGGAVPRDSAPAAGAPQVLNVTMGGGGGGGGRGSAGNAGGNSPTVSGSAATPLTFNCVPVTPGGTAPITVASPGGQIVISWNPQ
jgi:hypothetical protein